MDYYERIQTSIDYIEDNLKNMITLEDVAETSFFSKYHFHRIFQSVVGESVMEYIRKRRLSEAVFDLQRDKLRITDIAYEYLFNSADTFSRAFKRQYGINPEDYRKNQPQIELYVKRNITLMNHKNIINPEIINDPTIILVKEYKVVGLETFISSEEFFNSIENNLENREADHTAVLFFSDLKHKVQNQNNPGVEICYNYDCRKGYINMVCVEADSFVSVPEGMVARTIPGNKYAVFTYDFKLAPAHITIKDLEEHIFRSVYKNWFPNSNYEPSDSYTLEFYNTSRLSEGITTVEVYIPIK
jgi:AraC family transcriptional regulator